MELLPDRRRFLRTVLGAGLAATGTNWLSGVASAGPATVDGLVASPDLQSLDAYTEAVTFWKQRVDLNGDGIFDEHDLLEFLGRKGVRPGDGTFHFAFDLNGDDAVGNDDIQLLFDLLNRCPEGFLLDPFADVTALQTIAAYYPWYSTPASWASARSTPLRGRYQSFDSALYLQQRLEAHASGIDVFAVSTFNPLQVRLFHDMQAGLEEVHSPDLTRFLWLYEILGRLPFELNSFGQEIVDFDQSSTPFFGLTHYGIYTPRFTDVHGGRFNQAHADFTITNLRAWIEIVRNQGIDTVYHRPMIYWPPTQFGFDDTKGTRNNPPLAASRDEIEYYVQQLDRRVVQPNVDIITHLNHTSYNEHREGHGLEPTDGYNGGRSWLQIMNVYRGPSRYYRRTIVRDSILRAELASVFDAQ